MWTRSEFKWVRESSSEFQWIQVISSEFKWIQESLSEFKWRPLPPTNLLSNFSWPYRYIYIYIYIYILRASPTAAGPPVCLDGWMTGWLDSGWCWNGLPFIPQIVILETLRVHFRCPDWPFWWPGTPWETPMVTLGSQRCFLLIFDDFGVPLGTHLGTTFSVFAWFCMSIRQVKLRCCF
mgnify:CR=1 FL=1